MPPLVVMAKPPASVAVMIFEKLIVTTEPAVLVKLTPPELMTGGVINAVIV